MTGALWSDGVTNSPERDEADFWGIPQEVMCQNDADHDGVWAEHVAAVEAFAAVSNRWQMMQQVDARGHMQTVPIGLDLMQAEAGWRLAGIEMTPDLWMLVRVVEEGAKEALSER